MLGLEKINSKEVVTSMKLLNELKDEEGKLLLGAKLKTAGLKKKDLVESFLSATEKLHDDDHGDEVPAQVVTFYNNITHPEDVVAEPTTEPEEEVTTEEEDKTVAAKAKEKAAPKKAAPKKAAPKKAPAPKVTAKPKDKAKTFVPGSSAHVVLDIMHKAGKKGATIKQAQKGIKGVFKKAKIKSANPEGRVPRVFAEAVKLGFAKRNKDGTYICTVKSIG